MKGNGSGNGVMSRVDFVPAFLIVQRNGIIRINPNYGRRAHGKRKRRPKDDRIE